MTRERLTEYGNAESVYDDVVSHKPAPKPIVGSTPKPKDAITLIKLALLTRRLNDNIFVIPSESNESKQWYVDISVHTCRDQVGNGCPAKYYYGTCKHELTVEMILQMIDQWTVNHE
jgi:hypothetical protein